MTENNVAAQAGDEPMRAVVALAWKWHDEAVASGFAASEPAQELFALLGWPDRAATVKAVPSEVAAQLADSSRCTSCVDIDKLAAELTAPTAQQSLTAGGAVPESFEALDRDAVLEEAAKVADAEMTKPIRSDQWDDGYFAAAGTVAAFIRCLKSAQQAIKPSGVFTPEYKWSEDGKTVTFVNWDTRPR